MAALGSKDVVSIIAEIRAITSVGSGAVSDAQVLGWLNEGVAEVASMYRWSWLEAEGHFHTIDGQTHYDYPASTDATVLLPGCEKIIAIYHSSLHQRVRPTSLAAAVEAYGGTFPEAATATNFYLHGGAIYLLPIPTSAVQYNVFYLKGPDALEVSASSYPQWNAQFHHVLVHYGEWRMWQREEDNDKAQIAQANFYRILSQMISWYSNLADDRPWALGKDPISSILTNTPFLDGL
jgi:hypothetical protein